MEKRGLIILTILALVSLILVGGCIGEKSGIKIVREIEGECSEFLEEQKQSCAVQFNNEPERIEIGIDPTGKLLPSERIVNQEDCVEELKKKIGFIGDKEYVCYIKEAEYLGRSIDRLKAQCVCYVAEK